MKECQDCPQKKKQKVFQKHIWGDTVIEKLKKHPGLNCAQRVGFKRGLKILCPPPKRLIRSPRDSDYSYMYCSEKKISKQIITILSLYIARYFLLLILYAWSKWAPWGADYPSNLWRAPSSVQNFEFCFLSFKKNLINENVGKKCVCGWKNWKKSVYGVSVVLKKKSQYTSFSIL